MALIANGLSPCSKTRPGTIKLSVEASVKYLNSNVAVKNILSYDHDAKLLVSDFFTQHEAC